ncbi:MAG: hypothetical protein AAFQ78_04085, partial [Bacteroidota bacterium]
FFARQHYPEKHVKIIAFDSPGAKPMLELLNTRAEILQLDHLDITNYLSTPNFVNASSPHVGTVYQVVFDRFSLKPMVYNQQSHAVENFLRAFSSSTSAAYHCAFVQQWPLLLPIGSKEAQNTKSPGLSKAIHSLLAAFQRCTQDEACNGHKSFFKFVRKAFRYRSSPFEVA